MRGRQREPSRDRGAAAPGAWGPGLNELAGGRPGPLACMLTPSGGPAHLEEPRPLIPRTGVLSALPLGSAGGTGNPGRSAEPCGEGGWHAFPSTCAQCAAVGRRRISCHPRDPESRWFGPDKMKSWCAIRINPRLPCLPSGVKKKALNLLAKKKKKKPFKHTPFSDAHSARAACRPFPRHPGTSRPRDPRRVELLQYRASRQPYERSTAGPIL